MGLKRLYEMVFVWCFLQKSCNAALFDTFFELSNEGFVKSNTFVGVFPKNSLRECALLCASHAPEPCGIFIWKPKVRMCMLHSNTLFLGSVLALENEDKLFSRVHIGCQAAGYIYNFEANTCIKKVSSTENNWYDARAVCQQDGGDLIILSNKTKWDFVVDYVKYVGNHWIGLNAQKWVNGNDFVNNLDIDVNVNNYDSAYPNDGPSCGTLRPQSGVSLQDESCIHRLYNSFLCEIIIE